jgi:hypothetical protein
MIAATGKCKKLIAAFVLFTPSLLLAQEGSQLSGYDHRGLPAWVRTPKPQRIEPASDPAQAAIRQARNLKYNNPASGPLVPHDPGSRPLSGTGGADFQDTFEPVPSKMSDVVVVATALSFQPFLSADSSTVYTELAATPHEILKDKKALLVPQETFTILQRGGTLALPNGQLVESAPYGGSNPIRLATRYLLFLRYYQREHAFTVIRSWDLSQSKPHEMDNDGHPYTGRSGSLEDQFSSEDDLKAYVQTR